MTPWLPVDRDYNGEFCEIVTNPNALLLDQKPSSGVSYRLVSSSALDLNTNVQPVIPALDHMAFSEERKLINENDHKSDEGGWYSIKLATWKPGATIMKICKP